MARIVRAAVLQCKETEFVGAARALGASGPALMTRHVLPNVLPTVTVYATLFMANGTRDWLTMKQAFGKASTSKWSNVVVKPGDRIRLVTPGGGGCGDPKARDPETVRDDVREGYVTKEAARRDYGIAEV